MTPNIADIIRHHVSLEVRCIDYMYLHAYMPKLQTSDGLYYFDSRSSRVSDPIARIDSADPRSLDRRRRGVQRPLQDPDHRIRIGSGQRLDRQPVWRVSRLARVS
jgi:hypothetical protein